MRNTRSRSRSDVDQRKPERGVLTRRDSHDHQKKESKHRRRDSTSRSPESERRTKHRSSRREEASPDLKSKYQSTLNMTLGSSAF